MPLSHDSADTCSSQPAAEKSRSFQLKCSLFTEKEYPLGVRKPIPSSMRGFCFLSEASWKTTPFEFIYLLLFFFNPHGVMAKVLECNLKISELELQSRYYICFRTNTIGKGMNTLIPPSCRLYSITAVLHGWLWH